MEAKIIWCNALKFLKNVIFNTDSICTLNNQRRELAKDIFYHKTLYILASILSLIATEINQEIKDLILEVVKEYLQEMMKRCPRETGLPEF